MSLWVSSSTDRTKEHYRKPYNIRNYKKTYRFKTDTIHHNLIYLTDKILVNQNCTLALPRPSWLGSGKGRWISKVQRFSAHFLNSASAKCLNYNNYCVASLCCRIRNLHLRLNSFGEKEQEACIIIYYVNHGTCNCN